MQNEHRKVGRPKNRGHRYRLDPFKLWSRRTDRQLTQPDLCELLKELPPCPHSRTTLSDWEGGKLEPTDFQVMCLAKALDTKPHLLCRDE